MYDNGCGDNMKNIFLKENAQKIGARMNKHRTASIIVGLLFILAGYSGFRGLARNNDKPRYVLAAVEKGTLVTSISGSGQVSALNQIEIKPEVQGNVVYIGVKEGQRVKAGALIVQIDSRKAERAVKDAEDNLLNAQLALQKLTKPAEEIDLRQAENDLNQAKSNQSKTKEDLEQAYANSISTVAGVISAMPDILGALTRMNPNQWQGVDVSYFSIGSDFEKNYRDYEAISRNSDRTMIGKLIDDVYSTVKKAGTAIKNSGEPSYLIKADTLLSNVLKARQAIQTADLAVSSAELAIAEKNDALLKLKEGPDELDLQSQGLTIRQRENAVSDAKDKLDDCYIRAPFAGVVAELNVNVGDNIATAGDSVATLITEQQIADVSLNEVDIIKVKASQKATLTFDAIPDFAMAGSVTQLDAIGSVSQGVVSYKARVALDAKDERVKPGMSVSVAIITEIKQDVLLIPNGAIKNEGGISYVETPGEQENLKNIRQIASVSQGVNLTAVLSRREIQIGSANDALTEVAAGLKEGDMVIVRTINSSQKTSSSSSSSNFQTSGLGGMRGKMMSLEH